MELLKHLPLARVLPIAGGLAALLLAGCAETGEDSSEYPYGNGTYATGYPNQYPVYQNGQPVYQNGQPVYQNGQPAYQSPYQQPVYQNGNVYAPAPTGYPGQPMYSGVDATDDYIYYPDVQVYYSPMRQEWGWRDHDHWEWRREAPRGVRADSGIHVRINGGPEHHDEEIRRQYPGRRRDHDWDDRR